MRIFLPLFLLLFLGFKGFSQPRGKNPGIIIGTVLDSSGRAIQQATVSLIVLPDSIVTALTDKNGFFEFTSVAFGFYKLEFSSIGYSRLVIDSIHVRQERFDFNLGDIRLGTRIVDIGEVIVYSEKPLIESKDGNIIYNAGESALAAGSTAGELLNNVPLVTKDPSGKILVRGKEPKILIDDKPVELNLQQVQDLLESMPGSSIEKIEVLTNPPPQYANEQGGVINIVTKKGKLGIGGRISATAGTRGEGSLYGNFNYRKNKIAININAGAGMNRFEGHGNSSRRNVYADSSNFFTTSNNYLNKNLRPNIRLNLDYEISKTQMLNLVANFNQNNFDNSSLTEYTNINRNSEIYRLSERTIGSEGNNRNLNFNFTYTLKSKKGGEQLRIITGSGFSRNHNNRIFFQEFFNPDHTPNGIDSTQQQLTNNAGRGYNLRVSYDKTLSNKKTFLSLGGAFNRSNNHIVVDASYKKVPGNIFVGMDLLSNDFKFHQGVKNLRASVKQVIAPNFSITAGMAAEATMIGFNLLKDAREVTNDYWSFLPFGNINKSWKDRLSLTLAYRRTIRRPGINELNPTIDFSDPYNVRFGNYQLMPSLAHNFNIVVGRTRPKYFLNLGAGYNLVENIYSQVRTLLPEGKTQVTWENISDRKEYEISTWNGFTLTKKMKINLSATYVYNIYSAYDRKVRKFRNGASFSTNFNGNYSVNDIWNYTGNFTLNRFANPQGSVSWNLGMNVGIQKKFFNKRFIVTLNFIDPFRNQQTRSYTNGTNFELRSYSTTETRNFRLTLAYNFIKAKKM